MSVNVPHHAPTPVPPQPTLPPEDPEVPRYRDRGDSPTGTFAGSGAGWITAQAPGLADHHVRLELHDERPPAEHTGFGDVLETPYRSSSGGISLAGVTDGPGDRVDLALGDDEWFRVRVSRGWDDTGDPPDGRYRWLLQFWPGPALEPPAWLARSEPARPPSARVDEVLSVAPERAAQIRLRDLQRRYSGLAEDLEAILRWTSRPPWEITTGGLARRLLVEEAHVRECLAFAEETGLLHADGPEPLRLWLGRRD